MFISFVTSQQVLLICDMECSQYPPEGSDREGRAQNGGNVWGGAQADLMWVCLVCGGAAA